MIDSVEASTGISDGDRDKLVRFLADLHRLLARLLSRQPPLLSPQTLPLLEAAWHELEREGRFEEARKWIEVAEFDRRLEEHGLHRAQLDLKVGVFELADEGVKEDEGKLFRFFKRRKGLMAWALKAGNVILGSLADVVPGVGAIQEFKDAAEAALDHRVPIKQRLVSLVRRRGAAERVEEPPEPMPL
jgi:hypothetical protein